MGSSLTECILVSTFSCVKIDEQKAQQRELARFDENRLLIAVGMLDPLHDKKIKARAGAGKGRHPRPRLVQKKTAEGKTSNELS